MYTEPMIFPLDLDGKIYMLQDETGQTVGTGSRKVCEDLLMLMSKTKATASKSSKTSKRANVRAVIKI